MISGASLVVAQLAQGFAHKGHDVLVIAASDRREGYSTQDGRLRVERLPSRCNPARVGQRFLLWPQRQLHTLVEEFEPDIIHLHEPLTLGICGFKAAQRVNTPAVLTLHQLPWFITKYTGRSPINFERPLWRYGKWFLSQCAATIVPMGQIAAVVKQHTGQNPHTIPNGTDLRHFETKSDLDDEAAHLCKKISLPVDKPIILHTGRLDIDKGVNHVIQAAAKVMQQVDAELLIVGDGGQRQDLIVLCKVLGIADRCHFTGFVAPDGDLPAIYRLADVFVTASEIETFGIVILEAMAASCPVVAVEATCIPELVDDNRSGFLLPPKDVDGLAEKMIWLLQNPQQAREMGREGQKISQKYDQETMLRRHLQLYQSIQKGQFHGTTLNGNFDTQPHTQF
jgi:glycosyltransferase involved in cell wall biosynthesis